jgi:hypothetical protein
MVEPVDAFEDSELDQGSAIPHTLSARPPRQHRSLTTRPRHKVAARRTVPFWRTTNNTDRLGAYVSCTIRAFSSADQRRRRCTDVITSIFPSDTGILLVVIQRLHPVSQ